MTKQEKREAILREFETMPDGFGLILVDLEGLVPEQLRTIQTIDNLYKRGTAPYWAGFALNPFGRPLMQELSRVIDEMHHQDAKFGPERDLDGLEWLAILGEEFGEVSKDVVDSHWAGSSARWAEKGFAAVAELIQVAAVAIQAAASLRRQYSKDPTESVGVFCACIDPAPRIYGNLERCENCGGVTKDFN